MTTSPYVYIRSEPGVWTVGFYKPNRTFEPESDHDQPSEAAKRVRYLNGGGDEVLGDTSQRMADSLETIAKALDQIARIAAGG